MWGKDLESSVFFVSSEGVLSESFLAAFGLLYLCLRGGASPDNRSSLAILSRNGETTGIIGPKSSDMVVSTYLNLENLVQ
jgi:hypothetical protein